MFMQVNLRMERLMSIAALGLSRYRASALNPKDDAINGRTPGRCLQTFEAGVRTLTLTLALTLPLPLALTDGFSCLAVVPGFKNPAA